MKNRGLMITLGLTKLSTLGGLGATYAGSRTLGGCLLALSGCLIAYVAVTALKRMRALNALPWDGGDVKDATR